MQGPEADELPNGGFVRPPVIPGIEDTLRDAFELNKQRMAVVEEREALKEEETNEVIHVQASREECAPPSGKRPKVATPQAQAVADMLMETVAAATAATATGN